MTDTLEAQPLLMGQLEFSEGLRWHNGRLWFSDLFAKSVYTLDGDKLERQVTLSDDEPSGLGFLAGGEPIVVAMKSRQLRTFGSGEAAPYTDMSGAATSECNDMLVDPDGRAYVSTFGYDLRSGEEARPGTIILVRPGEPAVVAADGLVFPNGIVLSPDRSTLIVSELFDERIAAFTVAADGSLSGRRVFAHLPGHAPDGLAIDAEGAVWASTSTGGEFLSVRDGGEVTHRIAVPDEWATSSALGGDDGRTLFLSSAVTTLDDWLKGISISNIRTARVDVPAARY